MKLVPSELIFLFCATFKNNQTEIRTRIPNLLDVAIKNS